MKRQFFSKRPRPLHKLLWQVMVPVMVPLLALLQAGTVYSASNTSTQPVTAEPWLDIPQSELVYLQLDQGTLVLRLAPQFAPGHSERFAALVNAGFYQGLTFYRVIDQFVFQAGLPEGETHPQSLAVKQPQPARVWPPLPAEFSWQVPATAPYTLVQKPELLAAETGFRDGFAVGRAGQTEWLLNCPLAVNMARSSDPDSATTDFAIMHGQAPRHLDRNMSVFAKVIWGSELLNTVRLGNAEAGGMIADPAQRTVIRKASLGTQLPPSSQLSLQRLDTSSAEFLQLLAQRRSRSDEFYQYKGNGALDICYIQPPIRLKTVPVL